jgi:hypothetical protein
MKFIQSIAPMLSLLLAASSVYAEATVYKETITLPTYRNRPYFGGNGVIDGITSPSKTNRTHQDAGGTVVFSNHPLPSLSAAVNEKDLAAKGAAGTNPFTGEHEELSVPKNFAGGDMTYQFTLKSPTGGTWVPVTFSGNYQLASTFTTQSGKSYQTALGGARIIIAFGQFDGEPNLEQANYFVTECGFFGACFHHKRGLDRGSKGGAGASRLDYSETVKPQSYAGSFTGRTSFLTDKFGNAVVTVFLQAATFRRYSNFAEGTNTAFIEPYFEIDPQWTAAGNTATLTMPENIGNSLAVKATP